MSGGHGCIKRDSGTGGPSEGWGAGCSQPLSKEAAPSSLLRLHPRSPCVPCRCSGISLFCGLRRKHCMSLYTHTYICTHTHTHKDTFTQCSSLCQPPPIRVFIWPLGGVSPAPPRTDPSHLSGGLAVFWLLLAPALTLLQGIPLCFAQIGCFSLILLSMYIRSPSWVYSLTHSHRSGQSFSGGGAPLASSQLNRALL